MAAPTFGANGAPQIRDTFQNNTPALPSGITSGMFLIAFVHVSAQVTIGVSAGWTLGAQLQG